MIENKFQLTVHYEDDGDIKKKNYTHAIADDLRIASLAAAKSALAQILGEDIKGFFIYKKSTEVN